MKRASIIKWFKRSLWLIPVAILTVMACDYHVSSFSRTYCTSDAKSLPHVHVGLVLGTSPKVMSGEQNLYYTHRIEAASRLYFQGIIDRILVSGDNRTIYYNEPIVMKADLLEAGIPEDCIHLDYAGLRTLDSMVRSKKVFGQDSIIVISQDFHNERAVYLARKNGIEAWGYNAEDVSLNSGFKTRIREYFARVKMMLDIYILHTQPRHLGDPIEIPND